MLQKKVARRIRELCAERGWSVYQLMKNCDASKNSIYNAVNGKTMTTIVTLCSICKCLEVSLGEFFSWDKDKRPHISSSEEDTLVLYRRLDEKQKCRLEGYMRAMLEEKDSSENTPD